MSKKRACTIGSPPENEMYGISSSIICPSTPKICSSLSSSWKALPGPLSSMQCRQARLHSLVTCHATYNGAPRSADPVAAGRAAGTPEPLAAAGTASVLHQALVAQLGEKGGRFPLDRAAVVAEALFQSPRNVALAGPRLDLAHHGGRGRIERVDLLGAGLEQHT